MTEDYLELNSLIKTSLIKLSWDNFIGNKSLSRILAGFMLTLFKQWMILFGIVIFPINGN